MYERQQSAYGYVPNYAKLFSHRPEILARWGRLLAEIRRPIDDRLFELATFAAAVELKSSACSLAHGQKLVPFINEESIQALAAGERVEALTAAEEAVVNFARKVADDASSIDQQDVDSLKSQGYSDAEVFDIVTTVAGRAFFTKIIDALGVVLDPSVNDLNKPFRDALTVGRAVSGAVVEVLDFDEHVTR